MRSLLARLFGRAARKTGARDLRTERLSAGIAGARSEGREVRARLEPNRAVHVHPQPLGVASLVILPPLEPGADKETCECQS